ncbi:MULTISPECIES: hypothetical protein [unclassified Bacillus (in: firmicutes)]|uniref:hypothetical protein n=1 Tax=unclassified Bacillus (in: firmicutes) TaxID=185979 RepID=UPI0008E763E2|nr:MULTISPECIES: hypothetical protein [unclassified Bacillus (in: firmicutes)]SFA76958.1 hypothetical protein SAMN02799634_101633 [Bacillus sp. UNCCL13]SFQ66830.1 hypothetical protein SAMN04488577_0909 [Bacillus sp. cl95]
MVKHFKKQKLLGFIICLAFLLNACGFPTAQELIINRYADALLTKNNELQFRFRINNEVLEERQPYKVKVTIHDEKLRKAIGKEEIVYGEEQVRNGQSLEADNEGEKFILMEPIPLNLDLHIDEIRKLIEEDNAVSIEVYDDQEVLGKAYLTNFSSEL